MNIHVLAGEYCHKTTTQFKWLAERAPKGVNFTIAESPAALENLNEADLFVAAGLYWSGSADPTRPDTPTYPGATEEQRQGFRDYVASGRPVLAFYGGIASFDDWPEFGRLLGFAWHWDITNHGPIKEYRIFPVEPPSPLLEGMGEFRITDENYINVQLVPGTRYATHLQMDCGDVKLPMLLTTEGQRVPGAGRAAYLALGHDMRAVEHPAFAPLFWKTVTWLTSKI